MTNTTTATTATTTILDELKALTAADIVAASILAGNEELILRADASADEKEMFQAKLAKTPMACEDEFISSSTYNVTGTVWFNNASWAVCEDQEHEGWHGFFQGYWKLYKYQIPEELGGPEVKEHND